MHRLFVAIRPPEPVREQLLDLMEGAPGLRWQDEEQLHLTLRFIGEVERPVAEDVVASLANIRFPALSLAISGIGRFDRRGGGVLWAGVAPTEQLRALAAKVERACQSAGLDAERRAFHPHVTLARWKGQPKELDRLVERHAALASPPWMADSFALYESHLGRSGAHYEKVLDVPLAA